MKENTVFFKCEKCGNVIGLISGKEENIKCCGENMKNLIANSTDAATEKHVPVFKKEGNEIVVKIGETPHPMDEDHYIMWVAQVSENRTTRVRLNPAEKAEVRFPYIENSTLYSYCNKHGLWKTEI